MTEKEEFISIYNDKIKRDGADKLLDFLENKSDFFIAPAIYGARKGQDRIRTYRI